MQTNKTFLLIKHQHTIQTCDCTVPCPVLSGHYM